MQINSSLFPTRNSLEFVLPQHQVNSGNQPLLQPSNHQIKQQIKKRPKFYKNTCGPGKGKWTFEEQECYIRFLQENLQEMKEKSTRKSQKVFLHMARIVKSRTADQCRSHHQKILKYHSNLEETIRYYTQDIFPHYEKLETTSSKPTIQQTDKDSFHCVSIQNFNTIRIILNTKYIASY